MTELTPSSIDFQKYPAAEELIRECHSFLSEIKDLTPGHVFEAYLNEHYSPASPTYQKLARLCLEGHEQGWIGRDQLDGPRYTRDKIELPCADSRFLSITCVYMDSKSNSSSKGDSNPKSDNNVYSGQYHVHPYGEINCVIPVTAGAEIRGMQGWQGAGWTSPGPGTHHYPQVRNGALMALFFLPAGRIAYDKNPGDPQPESL